MFLVDSKQTEKDNNNTLPPIDNVEGDDEITYDITGSINNSKAKTLVLSRGRL